MTHLLVIFKIYLFILVKADRKVMTQKEDGPKKSLSTC